MDQKESEGLRYRKRPAEKIILRGLYDIFIAPVCAIFATITILSIELIVLAFSSGLPLLLTSHFFSHLDEDAMTMTALSISTVCSMIFAAILPNSGSVRLALPVGISTVIAGLISLKFNVTSMLAMGLFCGAGSAIGAILYWSLLEDKSKSSISRVLTDSYANLSALNQKPKEVESKKSS
uniref:Uncharacterized protein n=1 Tax=Plectus sambesii TaxID=2011161 RepID=A0A914W4X1_9BILA